MKHDSHRYYVLMLIQIIGSSNVLFGMYNGIQKYDLYIHSGKFESSLSNLFYVMSIL